MVSAEIDPSERCPAAQTARLVTCISSDGGALASYDDGSLWFRPYGERTIWKREEGPAWVTPAAGSRTFGMIKVMAVDQTKGDPVLARALLGGVVEKALGAGLSVAKIKPVDLTREAAEALYTEHRGRPYFEGLMESVVGRVVLLVLEGTDAVARWRKIIGPTNPDERGDEHLRFIWGSSRPGEYAHNGFHGSDSPESAEREIEIMLPYMRETALVG